MLLAITATAFFRVAILSLAVLTLAVTTYLLRELRAMKRERIELIDELRSQHVKDSFVNEAIGLHRVIDMAHREGRPLDDDLRAKVHQAMNEAFQQYREAAALQSQHRHVEDVLP